MTSFKVVSANVKKEIPDGKFGPMKVVTLTLDDGSEHKNAEWFTKAQTQLPAPGSQIDGEITQGEYGLKFKKAAPAGGFAGGGGPRPEDPKKAAAIARMHAQDMALQFCQLLAGKGQLPDKLTLSFVWKLADQFAQDAEQARKAAA